MVDKTKILYLDTVFSKELQESSDGQIESILIEGYASTNDIDRSGDIVSTSVWELGLENYLKNPIILAYHDYTKPVGRMVEHRPDPKGLWIKARISSAAEDNIFELVKDEVMTAFSIGFRVKDAEYNQALDVFLIKEIELHEISVVSVPCNQNTLFSLSKAFDTAEDYNSYKMLFAKKGDQGNKLETPKNSDSKTKKEWNMTPEEIQAQIAKAAAEAAEKALAADREARAKAEAEVKAKADADAALDAKIKAAVSSIQVGESGAEKLVKELEARMENQSKSIEDLLASVKEKTEEIAALQKSKMSFGDKTPGEVSYEDKEKAVLLSKMSGKAIEATKLGAQIVKLAPHSASATWETEVSLRMEEEVRRQLVVSPILRQVAMQTNVMKMPLNPEAGYGTWVTNAQFGTSASSGATATHQLSEITLSAYKVATREYMNYEEEEDSLIVLMPIVRDAMIRRVAKSVDKAFLLGAGSGADPVQGLAMYDATSAVTSAVANKATVANMIALRRDLGAWGLNPSEVTYIVSTDIYYDLLEDATFQTVDKIGDRATLRTGQIGSIANSPVLVSAQFPTKASGATNGTTNIGAIAVNTSNFIVGNQRGLRMDTQDLVETQQKVLVASLRTGMTQLTTNLGGAVSTFRWTT